ncbi:MAG: cytochrome ubiquinol oxidase subunit I [Desulfovibrionaceae bacterium]|jgi:mono/diheme cytochrome c family protein|nr:cytochrome ubiquinol oxidase subunit I [Desulfovibrionaceae bacterium]
MEYPVWQVAHVSTGFLVALISVFHVYIAHFAVGGGLFLVLTELRARASGSPAMLDYVRRHTKFFLLTTMVAGGITGVGIWFVIGLASPEGTALLVKSFVFGWATEWVFFVGEIVALLIYYYAFDRMDARDHQIVGWLYFAFAFLSLFVINGIVGFMLTPGDWLQTRNFWDGFFNPSFWPSLAFRTFLSLGLAGFFALVTAPYVPDPATRDSMMRYAGLWVAAPFVFLLASGWWYVQALPPAQQAMVEFGSPQTPALVHAFIPVSLALVAAVLFTSFAAPNGMRKFLAVSIVICGITQIGVFEWARETARRPWVVYNEIYSNCITPAQAAEADEKGLLATARWTANKKVTEANMLDAGRELFMLQCKVCHGDAGPMLDVRKKTEKYGVLGLDAQLNGQGKLRPYMPPFVGTPEEREALAAYVVADLGGKSIFEGASKIKPVKTGTAKVDQLPFEIPSFDADKDEYVLLAWNNLGMHCISDSDKWWILLPPANDLYAQLIRRGPAPEVVTEGVTLSYDVEKGFENPSGHVDFWKHAKSFFGKELPVNVGVSGNPVTGGKMHRSEDLGAFEASLVPVVPYPDSGGFNPYPLFTITARDAASGKVLATTRMVAPTSTEMGCKNCHGGEWRVAGVAGFTDETSRDVLAVHDRINKTDLVARAESGNPVLCQSCHADPVLGTKGQEGIPNFPAALHGWHANYLTGRGTEVCYYCHPAGAAGPTGCLRGVHAGRGLDCTDCHGYLEDHALSLLKKDKEAGIKAVDKLMANLTPRKVKTVADVKARTPWLMEPDCLSCHDHEALPKKEGTSFNKWTSGKPGDLYRLRHDDMGAVMCEGCHGSTHAVYPAHNIYGADRDNIVPLQHQGLAAPMGAKGNCAVCHTQEMDDSAHHPIIGQ